MILYNLGIGATENELKWVYEGDEEFQALPTFGVIPGMSAFLNTLPLDWLPNYNPVRSKVPLPSLSIGRFLIKTLHQAKLLHGEQYLSIKNPISPSGELVSDARYVIQRLTFLFLLVDKSLLLVDFWKSLTRAKLQQ